MFVINMLFIIALNCFLFDCFIYRCIKQNECPGIGNMFICLSLDFLKKFFLYSHLKLKKVEPEKETYVLRFYKLIYLSLFRHQRHDVIIFCFVFLTSTLYCINICLYIQKNFILEKSDTTKMLR